MLKNNPCDQRRHTPGCSSLVLTVAGALEVRSGTAMVRSSGTPLCLYSSTPLSNLPELRATPFSPKAPHDLGDLETSRSRCMVLIFWLLLLLCWGLKLVAAVLPLPQVTRLAGQRSEAESSSAPFNHPEVHILSLLIRSLLS